MKVHVKVPATAANLGAGLDCLGVAVDLWNELIVEEASGEEICIHGEGEEDLPRDSQNLTVTSFKFFISMLEGVDPENLPKFKFVCINNIPLARGLGSSTAAVVAGLLAAAALGPHLQSRKNDGLSGPTISTDQPCNWAAMSSSADAATDITVLKPAVFPTQRGSRALAILGEEATCSCLQDSINKHLGSDNFVCGTHSSPSVLKQHSDNCVSGAGSDISMSKAVEGSLPHLKGSTAGGKNLGCLSVLLQIASEIEGHADNAAPAIYGGLRLTLAGHFRGDEQTRDGTEQKNALNMHASKPGGGLTTQKDVEGATFSEDINKACTSEEVVADAVSAENTDTHESCASERCDSSPPGHRDGSAQGGFTEPTVPFQLVSSGSTGAPSPLHGPGKLADSKNGGHAKKWIAKEIPVPPGLKLVFFIPTNRLLTKTAREALPHAVRLENAVYNVARSALFVHCLTASAAASAAAAAACSTCCRSADGSIAPNSKQRCLAAAVGIPRNPHTSAVGNESSASEVAAAKAAEGVLFPLLQEAMNDKLHQPHRRALNPHLEPLIASAHQAGALGTALSGAGPSVVAFCIARRANVVACAMEKTAEQIKKKGRVLVTEPSAEGAHIVDLLVASEEEHVCC